MHRSHSFATARNLATRIIKATEAALDAAFGALLRGWMLFRIGTKAPTKAMEPTLATNLEKSPALEAA